MTSVLALREGVPRGAHARGRGEADGERRAHPHHGGGARPPRQAVNAHFAGDDPRLGREFVGIAAAGSSSPSCARRPPDDRGDRRRAVWTSSAGPGDGKLRREDLEDGTFADLEPRHVRRRALHRRAEPAAGRDPRGRPGRGRRGRWFGTERSPCATCELTLTCDHRAIDGADGAEFLQTLQSMLEQASPCRRPRARLVRDLARRFHREELGFGETFFDGEGRWSKSERAAWRSRSPRASRRRTAWLPTSTSPTSRPRRSGSAATASRSASSSSLHGEIRLLDVLTSTATGSSSPRTSAVIRRGAASDVPGSCGTCSRTRTTGAGGFAGGRGHPDVALVEGWGDRGTRRRDRARRRLSGRGGLVPALPGRHPRLRGRPEPVPRSPSCRASAARASATSLHAVAARPREAGGPQVDQPLRRARELRRVLYERFGFREVDERGDTVVMVAEIDGAAGTARRLD